MMRLATLFAMYVCLTTAAQVQTPAPVLEGTWRGTLETGGGSLRLVLRVAKAADGLYSGALDSLDQGSTIPIDRIVVNGASVRLELKAVAGTFDGTLSPDGAELKGTWSQGLPLPLTLRRDAGGAAPAATAAASPGPASFPFGLPLDMFVPVAPIPFTGNDGQRYLVYEVHLSNLGARDLLVTKFEVLQAASTVASFEGAELNAIVQQPGSAAAPDRRTIASGKRLVTYLWIPLTSAAAPLRHRVSVGTVSIEGAQTTPSPAAPIVIGPPLDGDSWMAANGPGANSGHRRALITSEGRARIAQRFAIDWVRMHPSGQTFSGDQKDNKSYRAYGADLLAVADAVVAATKDGIPENVPGITSRAVPITQETVGGNYVVLDLGGGRHAFYAHLQPGSLRVKTGDRVTRGQVLGLLGNSGNSTEPHLHFHVSDGMSPLGSEGLPYAIAGMKGMPLQNERVTFKR